MDRPGTEWPRDRVPHDGNSSFSPGYGPMLDRHGADTAIVSYGVASDPPCDVGTVRIGGNASERSENPVLEIPPDGHSNPSLFGRGEASAGFSIGRCHHRHGAVPRSRRGGICGWTSGLLGSGECRIRSHGRGRASENPPLHDCTNWPPIIRLGSGSMDLSVASGWLARRSAVWIAARDRGSDWAPLSHRARFSGPFDAVSTLGTLSA